MDFKLDNLSVRIGEAELLQNINLTFRPGELCMVIGPNGAGKTTLLRCLDGELQPSAGNISLGSRLLSQWKIEELARIRSVLPQHSALDFPFSVRDVVAMGRLPHSTSSEYNQQVVDEVMTLCDCSEIADRAYPVLSGGEKQRTHTARALAQIWHSSEIETARYLLLDEPVSALDLSHQHSLLGRLKSLSKNQAVGVICTMHNLNLAAQYADRCLILDRGMIVADGTPAQVFTEVTLSNVFDLDILLQQHPQDPSIPLIIPRLEQGT